MRIVQALTDREWEAIRHLRQKYFFDRVQIDDPYTWTFKDAKHVHFVLYKGTKIIGYAHIQLWPENRAAMRIIVIDEPYRNKGIGSDFLKLCERWLSHHKREKLLVQSSPAANNFYIGARMTKMHENEFDINETIVKALLKSQCPDWVDLLLKPVQSSGTDNALFRLGNQYVVRLPRVEWEMGTIKKSIEKEYEWIPQIARFLKIPISEPVFKGNPNNSYPWPWLVTKWNEGHNPNFEEDKEYELLAKDLANFINVLHGIKLANGPLSRRGVPLKEVDTETRKALAELEGEIDIQSVIFLWNHLSNLPSWDKEPVWVHGDFLPGNILIQNNRLSAVIDFSDVGMGDPACDLIVAWSLLNRHSRRIFKDNLENIDNNTWERGRGWALSIALIMLPYYKNSNPVLAALARRMIENVLSDSGRE